MKHLSSPLTALKETYDVVVIGSGYGGAIAASRLARAGRSVCLLERGKERVPGDFPATVPEALAEIQVNRQNLSGPENARTALYDFRVNADMNVFLGCGLGGTSLVNANVSLRADPWVFDDPVWPAEIRADYNTTLAAGFQRAEEMLKPSPYPADAPELPKLVAQEKSAAALGGRFYRPPINVNFEAGTNHVGVEQAACNGCGDCVTGCNVGAKNTLMMNYLPDAWNFGAEIFTQAEVTAVTRAPNGKWQVHFQALHTGREAFDAPLLSVQAEVVILGAGALGSTEILLRSQARGLELSPQLGRRLTGNGDVLAFAYNGETEINGVGFGSKNPAHRAPVGPCITGIIDLRGAARGAEGMVIEEGSMPGALADGLPAAMAAAAVTSGTDSSDRQDHRLAAAARQVLSLVPGMGPYQGAMRNTQTYLVMTHDDSGGAMSLAADQLRIDWPGVGRQPIFERVDAQLEAATAPLGGTFVRNPIWKNFLQSQGDLITVHPLGGCAMGADGAHGVVNHKGNVFAGAGSTTHEGLYVTDGAVIPRSLGVNPLLTISALAERTCALLAQDRNWTIDYRLPSKAPIDRPTPPVATGIQFTETMRGFFSLATQSDFAAAAQEGQRLGQTLEFTLTIDVDDLAAMIRDESHTAALYGTVTAPLLSAQPLEATEGRFTLLNQDPADPTTRLMTYQMRLMSPTGAHYFFSGFKRVHNDQAGLDLWADTTTLYITVYAGTDAGAPVMGKGILTIAPADFARQMTTMQVTNAADPVARLTALATFGRFFAGSLWEVFGPVTGGAPDSWSVGRSSRLVPAAATPLRRKRPLRTPVPEIHDFSAADGTRLRFTRYLGGDHGPVLLAHGLGVSSSIFSLDTVDTNLVESLCAAGYDVWNLDFRASIALPSSEGLFDGDTIATQDFPAAVDYIRKVTAVPSIQAVVHCFGSTTWFMAMLAGMSGVRSFVCSQIATHTQGKPMTQLKTGLHVPEFLEQLGIKSLNAYAGVHPGWQDQLLNVALLAYPIPFHEWCNQDVCRRIAFMYAPLYKHANLNAATHEAMNDLFGVANIKSFEHLALIGRACVLVGADGSDRYMPHLERLNLPITFLHGADNACFDPASTKATYDLLCGRFGPENYQRHVIAGYGHIDCIFGKDAARDVFPLIITHLDAHRT